MISTIKSRLAIFFGLTIGHTALYAIATGIVSDTFEKVFSIIYWISVAPGLLLGWVGLPVTTPTELAVVFPVVRPNALGFSLAIVFWLGAYWLLAYAIVRRMKNRRRNMPMRMR